MSRTDIILAATLILMISGCATHQSANITSIQEGASDTGTWETSASSAVPAAHDDPEFWNQLRNSFQLDDTRHKAVTARVKLFANNSSQVERIFNRGEPYLAYIFNEVRKRNLPGEITLLPFIESGYDPFAYSHGRAAGLWQFIPGTGKMYGLKQDWWYDGRRDIVASTEAALDYLEKLHKQFDGDWLLALAAYNSGAGTVNKAIRKNRKAGRPTDFWHLNLPKETSAYVPKLLAISNVVREPGKYGVTLLPVAMTPAFAIVATQGQLDIGVASELAGINTEELYRLNPGYNRWATHPEGPHQLVIPLVNSDQFTQNLTALPESSRVKWVRHKIRSGETLTHIARRYDTTVKVLSNTNQIRGTNIRAGKHLLVPVAAKDPSRYAVLNKKLQPGNSSGNKLTYRVRNGDSLWGIAHKHKVSVKQVTRWNRLDSGSLIKPGQKLVIWQSGRGPGTGKQVRSVNYTVRNGDSLYGISKKFSVSIADLRRWNNLSKAKYLQPGQHLKLYVDVTRLTENSHG
jgi:membrane-bound lytic murein transglycosylase D